MTTHSTPPAPALELLHRIKGLEAGDGSWPGAEVVDALSGWFREHGLDPDAPVSALPATDEPLAYRRTVTVELASWWPVDEDDLDEALRCALTGIGVRVQHEETLETTWAEVTGASVAR